MQLVHDYIVSLVNLYGVVHKEKVVEIYNEQNKDAIDLHIIEKIIQDGSGELAEDFAFVEGDYFVQEAIYVFDELHDSLSERAGKPFYIPTKKELLKYKDEFYFEKTKQYTALLRYVQNNFTDGDKSEAVEISEEIFFQCHAEISLAVIFDQLTNMGITFDDQKQVKKVMDLIMDLANNSRLWVNNGLTPNELRRIANPAIDRKDSDKKGRTNNVSTATEKSKVGRNEPCPCGSGKKYKKCCLP